MSTEDSLQTGNEETSRDGPTPVDQRAAADPIPQSAVDLHTLMQALLANITDKNGLNAAISQLPYTVDAVKTLRECLPEDPNQRAPILDFAAEILVDEWDVDKNKAGMMATLLSQTWKDWHPEAQIIQQLVELCETTIEEGDSSMVAIVQPTAFVLGALGHHDFYGKWLHITSTKTEWRRADLERNTGSYYGSRENQLAAIERHLKDANRTGLLIRAHDVGLLVQICEQHRAEELPNDNPEVQRTKGLLRQVIEVLEEHQQDEIVAYIQQYVG